MCIRDRYTEDEDGNLWVEIEPDPFLDAIMHRAIDVKNGKIDKCFGSSISIEYFKRLLDNDIVGYYDLEDKYKTDLQKEELKKTMEYKSLVQNFKEEQECVKNSYFCILYNLRYNKPYNCLLYTS